MEQIFFILFAVGILYSVISFLLGNVFTFGDMDADIGIDWSDIGFFDIPVSPFRPIVIAGFITVFGGIGLLLHKYYSLPAVLSSIAAFAAALLISFIVYRFVVVPVYRAQNGNVHSINDVKGLDAIVTSSIVGSSFGRIRYTADNQFYSAPARSEDGSDIRQGEKAVIVRIDKNVFYVKRKVETDLNVPG